MAKIMVQFHFPNTTLQQYDQVWAEIRASGHTHPPGLLYHAGGQNENDIVVVAVWESADAFMQFGDTLRPLLAKNGFPQVKPMVTPIHFELIGR